MPVWQTGVATPVSSGRRVNQSSRRRSGRRHQRKPDDHDQLARSERLLSFNPWDATHEDETFFPLPPVLARPCLPTLLPKPERRFVTVRLVSGQFLRQSKNRSGIDKLRGCTRAQDHSTYSQWLIAKNRIASVINTSWPSEAARALSC